MPKANILGIQVDVIDTDGLQEAIKNSIRTQRKDIFAYVNINAINIAQRDREFREFLNNATVAYCDGEGVRLGARILGWKLPPRIVLTYWIWRLCALCEHEGYTIFFLGGEEGSAERAVENVKRRYPGIRIAGHHHGFFQKSGVENNRVLDMINSLQPNILLVGFGMPRQEHWIKSNIEVLKSNVILPSGSMIEYTAGGKRPAPRWMADHGMEWLYRLWQEPGRLWFRYLVGNPMFMLSVLLERLSGKEH